MHRPRRTRPFKAMLLSGLVVPLSLLAATVPVQPTLAATGATSANPHNPLAGRQWGVYQGRGSQAWQPYVDATGHRKQLLAKIALRPKAKWFGAWVSAADIGDRVRAYIESSTGGDPDVLVQMTVFRMKPWEHKACRRLPTDAERASYKRWTDNFAKAIGDAHVALILQPDGPFALCAPHHSKAPSHLIRYSARTYGALPNTSVYIGAGAADWLRDDPARAARILVPAGVSGVRGFALNGTHYDSTRREIRFGTAVVKELARRGISGKHFVINTSSNGRPFAGYTYDGKSFDNARVCTTRDEHRCVTLGIPPTANVTDRDWGLSRKDRARAARHVDGYLWFGRPWLYMQADPFVMKRALAVARTTPY
ncbi:MAG TPA: glycoside hydrolase family 6 protein [Nocardioidaceae bacterium]|nr:glycoside hydrolase family 6 protein [Nocardioidaceae bacterium]